MEEFSEASSREPGKELLRKGELTMCVRKQIAKTMNANS